MAKLKAGVLGWPVAHSLSPKLHSYWLQQLGIDGEYTALAVEPENLEKTIRSLPEQGWQGCNVTLPHKEAVIPFLDHVDASAQMIGAVNTITVLNGKLHGSNTDAFGFSENIRHIPTGGKKAVALGAGGAAKAVWKALQDLGYEEVFIANRTMSKIAGHQKLQGKTRFDICPWEERNVALEGADLLVNTTSLGLAGGEPLEIDLDRLPRHAVVTDIVYKPLETPLLTAARARGNPVVDGLGMLIWQAIPGFEAWFGQRPYYHEEIKTMLLS